MNRILRGGSLLIVAAVVAACAAHEEQAQEPLVDSSRPAPGREERRDEPDSTWAQLTPVSVQAQVPEPELAKGAADPASLAMVTAVQSARYAYPPASIAPQMCCAPVYFDYQYPQPASREAPFRVSTELAHAPWNAQALLMRIGIKGYEIEAAERPAANLVFLIDVSGSMQSPDKLPLLKNAFRLLTDQLTARDRVSMVVYAGSSGVVLEPTAADRKHEIRAAIDRLEAGGSTNGAEGIERAYQLAHASQVRDGINRVVLATDGDFNVGVVDFEALLDMAQRQRSSGVALTTLGFGTGNYNDQLLERLADAGNGNYAYVDTLSEARKVLVSELSSTLFTIAKDVKIQVEFNPAEVLEYRLIGYADVEQLAQGALDQDTEGYRREFVSLVKLAAALTPGGEKEKVSQVAD